MIGAPTALVIVCAAVLSSTMEASIVKANSAFLTHRTSLQRQPSESMQAATKRIHDFRDRMHQLRQDLYGETTMPSGSEALEAKQLRQDRLGETIMPSAEDLTLKEKTAECFDASQWLSAFPTSQEAHIKEFSQGNQDGVLTSLFSPQNLGTTNKGFVEFGFPDTTFATSYGNGRHLISRMGFHPELLLDGSNENPAINLHKHFLTATNIVSIFEKYNVSKESDYVSVDIDSCDIWLFMAITKKFRPRVMTVEYNSNYGIDSYEANGCQRAYSWGGDNIYGASLSAIYLAAQRSEYTMVYASPQLDTFMVRNDLICPGTAPPLSAFTYATNVPIHRAYADEQGPRDRLVMDFKQWLAENPKA